MPLRRRQHGWAVARGSIHGLFVGALVSVGWAVACRFGWSDRAVWVLILPVVGLALGALGSLFHPPLWESVARSIDTIHALQDRTLTAWCFAQREHPSDLQRLQMDDALQQLQRIDVRTGASASLPRSFPWAMLLCAVAAVVVWFPSELRSDRVLIDRDDQVVQLADQLRETLLEELREFQELTLQVAPDSPEQQQLQELVAELNRQIEALQQPGVDRAEALAQLSEMQASLAELKAQIQPDELEERLRQLGEAFGSVPGMEMKGRMLQQRRYEEAAEELTASPADVSMEEATTLAEQLKPLAQKMREEGQTELASTAEQLEQAIEDADQASAQQAADQLASLAQEMALRMALASQLTSQTNRISEAKAFSLSGGKNASRSDQPRQTWGRGTAGDPLVGESTSIDGQRRLEEVTGTMGEGPSQRERVRATEGQTEQAERPFREVYSEYRRQAEDVLLHEPLPLGHRQMIRQYFESIRPDG